MKDYFRLQLRLNSRKIKDAGLPPAVGYIILLAVFIGLSLLLFYKSKYAGYIYPFIALTFIMPLSEQKRNDFLQICFGDKKYRRLRLLENLAIALPFVVFLLFKLQFTGAALVALLAITTALGNFKARFQFTIPTPFGASPYEFAAGFRTTYLFLAIACALAIIAILVSNFNLGIAALLMLFFVSLSFYQHPEPEYYVWSNSYKPAAFLLNKIKIALAQVTLLTLPAGILLSAFFFSQVYLIMLVMLLGYVYLCCVIAARYSAYPYEMNVPQGILLALCIAIPPAVIIILPYLFNRSVERLRTVLK